MESAILSQCTVLECLVVLFQVSGVTTLCLTRLFPRDAMGRSGRVGFVATLIGLGIAGALCGRHESQFALFAGVTMTILLIGMIAGAGPIDLTDPTRTRNVGKNHRSPDNFFRDRKCFTGQGLGDQGRAARSLFFARDLTPPERAP